MKKGKFIVLYGINNLGKSTQVDLLIQKLKDYGITAEYLKYGVYTLEPSGVMLNEYLRKENPYKFSPREFQMCHAFNRTQYEPILKQKLESGIWIIGEDYKGTGIAWGVGAGVDQDFLIRLNGALLEEDLPILFDGERFVSGIEKNHKHEQDAELTNKVRAVHLDLAKKFGWNIINANQSVQEVHENIWTLVREKFQLK
jgi:dTMP kinase